jgi:hypothetical protein
MLSNQTKTCLDFDSNWITYAGFWKEFGFAMFPCKHEVWFPVAIVGITISFVAY